MRFAFTPEQRQFQGTIRTLLDKACPATRVRAAWTDASVRRDVWMKLAESGLPALTVPESAGGLGLRELDWVLALEETGRAAAPGPIVETVAVGAPLLGELQANWPVLSRVASGEALIATKLDGASTYALDADVAELIIVQWREELHAIAPGSARLTAEASVDGARRLFRVDGELGGATRIASGELAQRAIAEAFDRGALGASAQLLGLAQRMIDMTADYVKVRHQFGVPVGSFQAVKHHLANALLKLDFARPLVYRAAHSLEHRDAERAIHVSMAKAFASDAATFAARTALQCHGAIGYSFECDLHLYMKRAWALAAAWGDPAFHRARVGAHLFSESKGAPAHAHE